MPLEPRHHARPSVARGFGSIHLGARVIHEGVTGAGIDDHFVGLARGVELLVETRDVFLLVQEALASLVHPTEIHTRSEVDLVASRHKLRIAISSLEFEVERIDRQMQKRTELLSP